MPWLKRKGRWYFYLRKCSGGKRQTQYIGRGHHANLLYGCEVIETECKLQARDIRRACVETYRQSRQLIRVAELLLSSYLELYGFHNPKYRGLRRPRKMVDFVSKSQTTSDKPNLDTLSQAIDACNKGDLEATKKIRTWIKQYPELFIERGPESIAHQTSWLLTRKICTKNFDQEMLLARSEELRQSLVAEGTGTTLERLSIELVLATQLTHSFWSSIASPTIADPKVLEVAVRASLHCADKHRRAIESLAQVRQIIQSNNQPSNVTELREPIQPVKVEDVCLERGQVLKATRGRKKKREVDLGV